MVRWRSDAGGSTALCTGLADPVVEWSGGAARWSEAVYVRLRGAITARDRWVAARL